MEGMTPRVVTKSGSEEAEGLPVQINLSEETDFSDVPENEPPPEAKFAFKLPPGFFEPIDDVCVPVYKVTYLNVTDRGTKNKRWRVNIHVENVPLPFTKDFERRGDASSYMQELMYQIIKYQEKDK